jgi:hypothetical protein
VSAAETVEHVVDARRLVDIERTIERRAEYRAGWDVGVKVGATRYFQSPVMECIAFELVTLRTLYGAVCDECERRGRLIETLNRIKVDALRRGIQLARELDRRAPGWDKR